MIAIIPARGGSRRIPRKNIRDFCGQPIIAYSIRAAQMTRLFARVIVSTDAPEVADVAERYQATVHWRAADAARDEVGTQEVTARVLESLGIHGLELVVCIYATAPMLRVSDLYHAVNLVRGHNFVMSVGAHPLRDAGQFYMGSALQFRTRKPLIATTTTLCQLPEERICDINTEEDWARAEKMYEALR